VLNVRDKRVHAMARELARKRGVTMTQVLIDALENELERERTATPPVEGLLEIGRRSAAKAGPASRAVDRTEIDDMWMR
jgi:antitoxin VapB